MSIATQGQQQAPMTVKALVSNDAMKRRFAEVLKEKAPGFLAALASQCAVGQITKCNPQSVVAAAFVAATLDLPINRELGFAWIVPYKGVGQFQLGYKGYIQLAMRTGQYKRMNAFKVNAEALAGYDEVGEPIIDHSKLDETKEAVGYAFAFSLSNGFLKSIYWPKEKVLDHAKRFSQSFKSSTSPWQTDFDAMALKTVIANGLKKWGPLSVEMNTAFFHDQGVQDDVDGSVRYLDNPTREQEPMGASEIDRLLAGPDTDEQVNDPQDA